MIRFYDEAILNKIKSWVLDPRVNIIAPEETTKLFQIKSDENKDTPINLPLIAIRRERSIGIRDISKKPLTYNGKVFNNKNNISDHLNAIPINLEYSIDIYTRKLEEADEYVRNFLFNLINYPNIIVDIPYNGSNLRYTSFLSVKQSIDDNSDIPERLISGQFSRMTLGFNLNDAYLFSYNHREVPKIKGIEIHTKIADTEVEDPIIEEINFKK